LQSVKLFVADPDPEPIGEAGSIADIQQILRHAIAKNTKGPPVGLSHA
jgi:hypothetical protein